MKTLSKQEIRREMKKRRASLSLPQREEASRQIAELLRQQECYRQAAVLLSYASFRDEVDTRPIIEAARSDGKRVALPHISGTSMAFYYIRAWEDLMPGYQGIPEPPVTSPLEESGSALLLLPGLAFDTNFQRLGYGAGYYDRFLAETTGRWSFYKLALAFPCQIIDKLPSEPHDIPLDGILTPENIRYKL